MVGEAANSKLGDEKLLFDETVLQVNGRVDGMQHDETRSSVFRFAKKTLRDPVQDATLHESVPRRFVLPDGVQQYDVTAPYRPEALRNHEDVSKYYVNISSPHTTCWQRIASSLNHIKKTIGIFLEKWCSRATSYLYPINWKAEKAMNPQRKKFTPDSVISCLGLASGIVFVGAAIWILLVWQIVPWLREGVWHSYPITMYFNPSTDWVGFALLLNWVLALPVTLMLALVGVGLFWVFGLLSTKLYQCASRNTDAITPSQTRA